METAVFHQSLLLKGLRIRLFCRFKTGNGFRRGCVMEVMLIMLDPKRRIVR
jgi:hypothetical protein